MCVRFYYILFYSVHSDIVLSVDEEIIKARFHLHCTCNPYLRDHSSSE